MLLYMVAGLQAELAGTRLERLAHGARHGPTIVGRAQAATLFVDDFRERTGAHGYHGGGAGHRFENDQAECFLVASMHQQVGAGDQPGHLRRRAEVIDDADVGRHAGRHVRAYQ